jgi:hypothetical protein
MLYIYFGFVAQKELGFSSILKKFGMIRNDVDYLVIYKSSSYHIEIKKYKTTYFTILKENTWL